MRSLPPCFYTVKTNIKQTFRTIWNWKEVICRQPSWAAGRRSRKDLPQLLKRLSAGFWGPSPSSASAGGRGPTRCLCCESQTFYGSKVAGLTDDLKQSRIMFFLKLHLLSLGSRSATKGCPKEGFLQAVSKYILPLPLIHTDEALPGIPCRGLPVVEP